MPCTTSHQQNPKFVRGEEKQKQVKKVNPYGKTLTPKLAYARVHINEAVSPLH